jgi:hypothetical protein
MRSVEGLGTALAVNEEQMSQVKVGVSHVLRYTISFIPGWMVYAIHS